MKPIGFDFEEQKIKLGYTTVAGADEVGRGALAGPVVAAAVAFGERFFLKKNCSWHNDIQDSKVLTAVRRQELAFHIKQNSVGCSLAAVSPQVIDKINIHRANLLALRRAVEKLQRQVSAARPGMYVCVDGRFLVPGWSGQQEAVVHGDARIFSVAAASIVAKVYRDALMVKLEKQFPGYGFAAHKGYGTRSHLEAIQSLGITRVHRKTFCETIDAR